ncbi:UNVERIFIED_CONTAM: Histone deacetylase 5 [Sesamum radiatum]|uniref:histone deacetylase n=1 Tax=Sesamum radiatum TaxID=300843 RepID=A0AAW2L9Z1_SESRA
MDVKDEVDGPLSRSSDVATPKDRRVGLIYDERMCQHYAPDYEDHPECPDRVRVIWDRLNSSGLAKRLGYRARIITAISENVADSTRNGIKRCIILNAKDADDNHLALVHTKNHIDLIKSISSERSESRRKRTAAKFNSIYFNEGSSDAAYLAAGSVIEVAEKVAEGKLDSGFAIVRPPGHHAEEAEPMGFCLYNNVAIATSFLLNERRELGINKILIVDWDVHHGNGTQKMFYKDPRVLFFSVHRHDFGTFYPAGDDGSYIMTGEGPGAGYNINVPWENSRCGDADYLAVWDHILIPVAQQFNPDMIIISAGFDAAIGDPLGGCRVSPYGYSIMLDKLMEFAGGKIVMALEGGYNLKSLANSAQACVEVLLQDKPVIGTLEAYPFESTWRVIQEVRQQLSAYWPILAVKLSDKVIDRRITQIQFSSSDSDDEHEHTPSIALDGFKTVDDVIQPFANLKVNEDCQDQEATTSLPSWRSELSKINIWYATFGSNMSISRFLCYIEGGQTEGMQKPCVGSVDKTKPKEIIWKTFPHRLFFARVTSTWGPGGVAFLHPKIYLICILKLKFFAQVEPVQRGWYHNVVYLGKEEDIPILTMTCTASDVDSFISGKFPINPPCKEYANTLIKGLVEGKQLSEEEASAYIHEASTKPL